MKSIFSKQNLLLLSVSTVVSLLLAELVLRAVTPKAANFNHHQLYCEYDSLLGWRKTPNTKGHHKTPEYEVLESINSQGIRGPEYPLQKDSGEYRIAVLGDSFSEGYTVGFDSLFSQVLKQKLVAAMPQRRIEVINFGTGGYSTDQELLCFERDAVRYSPDYTVLLFCTNDPWFNNQARYYDRGFKPLFVQEADSLQLTNVPVPTMAERSAFSKTKDWLLRNSELVRRLKNLRDNARYAASKGQAVPDEWRIYQKADSPEMAVAWQVTAGILQRLRQKTAAAGSQLAIFYIPEKTEVYDSEWQTFLKTYTLDASKFDPTAPRMHLAAICDSLQIPLINAVPSFIEKAKAEPTRPLYFKEDWHWNVNGNRLTGEILADFFEKSIQFYQNGRIN
ncbi:MAG: SGNH/GDSL hydrolase family protein [Saprospiraceae bacterium]|nr:SGNH/GDSL hydrolase family protein [Saprospiraceae bacterium]